MEQFYRIKELRKNIYHIDSEEQVAMDLFVGSQKALLFDTGYGYGHLKEVVKKMTALPLIIVNSHGHLDHTCGNFQFEENIYIHPADIELCHQHNTEEMRRGAVGSARHTVNYMTGECKDILPEDFDEEAYIRGGCGNLVPVKEGQAFDLGDFALEVVEVPGHTRGSIALYHRQEKLFFAGDSMNPFVWLFAPEATMLSEYIRTLKKAEKIDFDELVIAHGADPMPKAALADFLDAAEHVDFDRGIPFRNPLCGNRDVRICPRAGYGPQDMGKPGFASVVISRENIDG